MYCLFHIADLDPRSIYSPSSPHCPRPTSGGAGPTQAGCPVPRGRHYAPWRQWCPNALRWLNVLWWLLSPMSLADSVHNINGLPDPKCAHTPKLLYCIVLHCIAFLGSGNPLRVHTAVILSNKGAHLGVWKTSKAGKRPHKWITRPQMCARPNIIVLYCIVL